MIGAGIILAGIILFYGISKLVNWLHDVNYQHQQTVDKTEGNNAEANANTFENNANQHEANANALGNKQKELEKDEQKIKQERADKQKILANSKQQSKNTRDALDKSLNQTVPNRDGDDGTDDDQLRSDSNTAATAFNGKRSKAPITPKP